MLFLQLCTQKAQLFRFSLYSYSLHYYCPVKSPLSTVNKVLPWWLKGKNPACSVEDLGLIPGSGSCPGGGHGNLLQYSCLENPMDRGAWWAIVHGVAESQK